jgi:hypothetical protein
MNYSDIPWQQPGGSWLQGPEGEQQWQPSGGQPSYYDAANKKLYMQLPGQAVYEGNFGDSGSGLPAYSEPSAQYWVVDGWENGMGARDLQGKAYNTYNNDGSLVKSGNVTWAGNDPLKDAIKNFAIVAGAGLAAGGLAGASAGGTGAAGTTAGTTAAGASSGSSLYGLGSATGGASGGLGLSAGGSGLGLSAATGSGLSLAAPAAGSLGGGLGLTAGAGALGAIGTTGLAAGAGSLLGSNALSGTYTLANGATIPLSTAAAGSGLTLSQIASGAKALGSALNGGGGGGVGGNLGQIIAGAIDADRQGKSSDKILEWLKSRTDITDNLYKPGTPEYNQLWDEMSRKDAATGRNSQYGPRSVDLAAKIAQIKASENTKMTTGIGQWMKGAYDQDASKYSGLMAGLGGSGGSIGGGLIDLITKYYNENGSPSLNMEDTVDEDLFQPEDGDYGQYF